MAQDRKFVSLQALSYAPDKPVVYIAVADDGSAWLGRPAAPVDKNLVNVDWRPLQPLPKKDLL
ncbi:hypothetical protein [Comamonas sp. 4034]|uniref:hypothetical protein n=1 Tax=Comamonas sp. 4034 TaxID=3156455 RepID=UPI003D1B3572